MRCCDCQLFDFLAPSELGTAAPLCPKPELPDGTAFSLVWRSGNALSAIFTRVTSATCGSRIITSIKSSGDRFSFALTGLERFAEPQWPSHKIVLLTLLHEGQQATVL